MKDWEDGKSSLVLGHVSPYRNERGVGGEAAWGGLRSGGR